MIFFDNYTKGQIVEFESASGYLCKGILYSNPQNDITVIHIHGSFGNFYDNSNSYSYNNTFYENSKKEKEKEKNKTLIEKK